jgi:predicted dehydrogenase
VICGRDRRNVQRAAAQLGWEESATDWREVVERPDIDVVDIATPGDSHAEIAIAAARAGKAILCEKPLANDVREARAMWKAVQKAGVPHMLCHNYRRIPAVMLARQLVASGKIGRIFHYRGTYLQDWCVDPALPLYWRFRKEKAGSGSLGDILSHSLDLGRYVTGSEVTEVSGALETFVKQRPLPEDPKRKGKVTVDDAALALVRFANGALGSIEGTRFAAGRKNYNRFELNGEKGSIAFDLERMNELEFYSREDEATEQPWRPASGCGPTSRTACATSWCWTRSRSRRACGAGWRCRRSRLPACVPGEQQPAEHHGQPPDRRDRAQPARRSERHRVERPAEERAAQQQAPARRVATRTVLLQQAEAEQRQRVEHVVAGAGLPPRDPLR